MSLMLPFYITFIDMPTLTATSLLLVTLIMLIGQTQAVDLILMANQATCAVLISAYEPIKVQAELPSVTTKVEGDFFTISLVNTQTSSTELELQAHDNSPFRQ